MAEKGPTATLHPIHGTQDLESTVAQEFVKYGFKVLLHHVVDGHCKLYAVWFHEPRVLTPGIPVYFGPTERICS